MDILIKTKQNSPDFKGITLYNKDLNIEIAQINLFRSTLDISHIYFNLTLANINLIHYIANNFDICYEEFSIDPNYTLQQDVDGDWYSHSINSESVLFTSNKDKEDVSTVIDIEGLTDENIERIDYMFNNICIGIKNSRLGVSKFNMYSKEGLNIIDSFIKEVRERFFPIYKLDSICAEQIQQLAIKYFSPLNGEDKDLTDAYIDRLNAKLYNIKGFDEKLYGDDLCFLYYNNPDKKEVTSADKDIALHNKVGNGNILGKNGYPKEVKTIFGNMELLGIVGRGGEEVYFEDKWGFIIKLNYREVDGLTMNEEGDIITVKEGLVIPIYTPPFKLEEVKLWQELRKQKVYEWWLECPYAFIVMNSKEGKSCIQDITRLYIEDSMVN